MKMNFTSVFRLVAGVAMMGVSSWSYGQNVGINATGAAPDASATLDVSATNKGFLAPRVADTNAIPVPVEALIIYDLSSHCYRYYTDVEWTPCLFGVAAPAAGPVATYCMGTPTAVVEVISPSTGEIWMDRNLGASQAATSSTDVASYGDLYQWGRFTDGHQCRTSSTTATNATTADPNLGTAWDGLFVTESNSPYDWLAPQNDSLWQGAAGTNNPCPSGYRLPTETELDTERLAWGSNTSAGAFASPLKLPVAGNRSSSNGALPSVGSHGYYWSSTVSGTLARTLRFNSSTANMSNRNRANGFSVRCIKD